LIDLLARIEGVLDVDLAVSVVVICWIDCRTKTILKYSHLITVLAFNNFHSYNWIKKTQTELSLNSYYSMFRQVRWAQRQ